MAGGRYRKNSRGVLKSFVGAEASGCPTTVPPAKVRANTFQTPEKEKQREKEACVHSIGALRWKH